MDPSDLTGGETLSPLPPSLRKMNQLQGLRPSPLKLGQDSHKIKRAKTKVNVKESSNLWNIVHLEMIRRPGMEFFTNAKAVRLRSHHDKYLHAEEDEESVDQDRNGSSKNARWTVEHVPGSDSIIRLKSCYGKYLTASNQPFLLGMTGRKVLQTLPRRLDSSVEWEPVCEGAQVKLKTRYGNFLRANGRLLPWRNSVTHDIPHRTATQDWILWDVDIVEIQVKSSRQGKAKPQPVLHWDSLYFESSSPSSVSIKSGTFSRQESTESGGSSPPKYEGRTIYYHVADESGDVDDDLVEAYSLHFKGNGVEELTQKLREETGLVDIVVCSRSPLNGKLYPLKLQLPPNNADVHVIVVETSSKERVEDIGTQMASRLKFQSVDAEFSTTTPKLKRHQEEITDLEITEEPLTPVFPDFVTEVVDVKMGMQDFASWKLFCQDVGEVAYFSSLQPMANEVVNLCFDNPDAISIMAAALKDVYDVDIWRKALEMLEMRGQPTPNQEILEKNIMITVLKFSYVRLRDDKTRKCLRNCAFLCKNGLIALELLIQCCLMDGLFVSRDEGKKMLKTLIDFNLLASSENDEFLKMEDNICGILLEHIVPAEEGGQFLLQSSLGLTEPPKSEQWEKSKEIVLMDNKLSDLPLSLVCPKLETLFLGRNKKLRKIPSSFFDHMPVLQVLNLSRTNIKSLPESLFKLASLRRLFLNHCDLIISLPPEIGVLKQLEVLDLAGTEITHLPAEIRLLTKLTCLEVSFFDPMSKKKSEKIIPYEVISALPQLEELNFDVSDDDKRWNASVELIVTEISRLQNLNTLKFYFPKVELLSYFNHLNDVEIASSTLSNFRFIVGRSVEHVISRVPREIEFELERYDRYLKYVNGEGVIDDIKKVLRQANAFFLDRHSNIRKLSDFGYANVKQLKCCVAGQCNDLEAIINGNQIENESSSGEMVGLNSLEFLYICYMKNLRCICEGSTSGWSFYMLKNLTLRTCPELTTIFTEELLANFWNLEELTIHDCPKITSLVSCSSYEDKNFSVFLPALKRISLHFLPNLTSISNGFHISQGLELMSFGYCRNLKSLPIRKVFNESLRKIKGESSWWQDLEWESTEQGCWDDVFVPVD